MSFPRKQFPNKYTLFSHLEANSKTDKNADRIVSDIKDAKAKLFKAIKRSKLEKLEVFCSTGALQRKKLQAKLSD